MEGVLLSSSRLVRCSCIEDLTKFRLFRSDRTRTLATLMGVDFMSIGQQSFGAALVSAEGSSPVDPVTAALG